MADERTGIKYIGKEPYYKDRIFGTGLVWKSGEALPLAVEVAKEFLKHPTLFQEVKGLTPLMGSTSSSGGLEFINPMSGVVSSIPQVISFPDFSPSILASFVAGTTASQSGTTVTVTATAHGIVGSNARNGYRIYFPGSASINAGWYPGFVWVDANTITFQRDSSATVASESVNGGAAYLAITTFYTATLPGGSMGKGRCKANIKRCGDAAAASKVLNITLAGNLLGYWALTSSSFSSGGVTFFNSGSESVQRATPTGDGATHTVEYSSTVNTGVDQAASIAGKLSAAAGWLCIDYADLEVVKL